MGGAYQLRPPGKAGLIDTDKARSIVRETSARFGFDIDPDALIEDLPVGAQQRVEIIKALSRKAEVLILDEPTAVLTPQETDELMAIMRQLAAEGTSIVFITHKLREVRAVADEITIIRRGKVVGTAPATASEAELASLMVGRDVSLRVSKAPADPGEVALTVEGLSVVSDAGVALVNNLDLEVRRGEIVAVAGVQGNGQEQLAEVLLGIETPDAGTVTLDGADLTAKSVRAHLEAGVGFVPEDRHTDGMVASFSIAENVVLDQYRDPPFSRGPALRPAVIREHAERVTTEFDVRLGTVDDPISTLSGGNQQKVVVARELARELRLLVVNQPTRGVDVGSIEFIHQRVVAARDEGVAVLLVSSELDEVLALADRIAVMYRGRIVGIVPADTSRDALGLMMAGAPQDEALADARTGAAPAVAAEAAHEGGVQ